MHRAPTFFSFVPRLPALLLAGVALSASIAATAQPGALPQDETARAAALQERKVHRDAERAEIERERHAMAQRKPSQEAVCYQRFAVEDCLAKLRAADREEEKKLRARELRINEEERREKSAERLRSIEQKVNEPRTPSPMQATPRQPLTPPQQPAKRTPADVAHDRATLDAQAQQRARSQAEYQQTHGQQSADKVQTDAERRAQAQADAKVRELEAAQRRARRDQAVSERKGAPLPVPGQP